MGGGGIKKEVSSTSLEFRLCRVTINPEHVASQSPCCVITRQHLSLSQTHYLLIPSMHLHLLPVLADFIWQINLLEINNAPVS